ncbi:MAG: hypothetical protein IS860_10810, partial [Nitrosopumilus sp.]|nr:hypothetical protein [Nitrosopumilus sp.]
MMNPLTYALFFIIPLVAMMPLAYGVASYGKTTIPMEIDVDTPTIIDWKVQSKINGIHDVTAEGNGIQYAAIPGTADLKEGDNTFSFTVEIPSSAESKVYTIELHMVQQELPNTGGTVFIEAAKKRYHITPIFADQTPVSSDDGTAADAAAAQAAAEKAAAEKAAAEKAAAEKAAA